MKTLESRTVFYPDFPIGCQPRAVECECHIVEANGRKYLKTPFAFLDAHGDDLNRLTGQGFGFYATAADVESYLAWRYPWAKHAEPLMDRWATLRHHYGPTVGDGRFVDECGCGYHDAATVARGSRDHTLREIKHYAKNAAAKRSA